MVQGSPAYFPVTRFRTTYMQKIEQYIQKINKISLKNSKSIKIALNRNVVGYMNVLSDKLLFLSGNCYYPNRNDYYQMMMQWVVIYGTSNIVHIFLWHRLVLPLK